MDLPSKLETRFDLSLSTYVRPPSDEDIADGAYPSLWKCLFDGCYGPAGNTIQYDSIEEWIAHAQQDHRGQLRFERKTVEMVTAYVPPAEEMFGGKRGKWRRESEADKWFRGRSPSASPPSPPPSRKMRSETDSWEMRPGTDSWVRKVDGAPVLTEEWESIRESGHDSWVRARDGSPPSPHFDVSSPSCTVFPPTRPETPPETRSGYPDLCGCLSCEELRQTELEPYTPPDRFLTYGTFPFLNLPGELRNLTYTIAINDAISSGQEDTRKRWRPLSLLHTTSTLRTESSGTYAATAHFAVPYRKLGKWAELVGKAFLYKLRSLEITFPDTVENARVYDFTEVYRLKCFGCPRATITLSTADHSPPKTVMAGHWSQTEQHVVKMSTLLSAANTGVLSPLFGDLRIITEIFVNVRGELVSVKATENLWLTYDDLRGAFGTEVLDLDGRGRWDGKFRLMVHELPWQMTALATTMAPKSGRKSKKELSASLMAGGVDVKTSFGISGLATRWGGDVVGDTKAKAGGSSGSADSVASIDGTASFGTFGGFGGITAEVQAGVKPLQPAWFSSSGGGMRGVVADADDGEESD